MSSSLLDLGHAAAWPILDRFGLELQRCPDAEAEVQCTLAAVAEALDADVVFWHSGSGGETPAAVGRPELSLAWQRGFVEHVLAGGSEDGLLLRHFLDPAAKPALPWPLSVALARISAADAAWLAALRFPPRPLFELHHLHALMLARRLLLNHRRRGLRRDRMPDALALRVERLGAAIDELVRDGGARANASLLENLEACRRELESLVRVPSSPESGQSPELYPEKWR